MRVECRGAAKPYPFRLRCGQSGIHAFADDFAFELNHGAQNVKLQLASGIAFRSVDALRGHDEGHFVRTEFIDDLRQVEPSTARPPVAKKRRVFWFLQHGKCCMVL